MSDEDKEKALAGLKSVEEELRLLGPMEVMAGTQCPPYWTSSLTATKPTKEFECVPLTDPLILTSLQLCLAGHGIGAGGRDADKGGYRRLELAHAALRRRGRRRGRLRARRRRRLAGKRHLL